MEVYITGRARGVLLEEYWHEQVQSKSQFRMTSQNYSQSFHGTLANQSAHFCEAPSCPGEQRQEGLLSAIYLLTPGRDFNFTGKAV